MRCEILRDIPDSPDISACYGVIVVVVAALLNPNITIDNLEPVYYPKEGKLDGILAVVAVAPWAFVGFDTVPQSAEEFHFSHQETKRIMVTSIIFGAVVYVLLNTVTAACIPKGYAIWVDYIDNVGNLKVLMALPTFYAAYQLLGLAGVGILGLAVTSAILSGIIGFYMASSRLLYAMSLENVIPSWVGKLDAKYRTSRNAILFVLIIFYVAQFFGRTALGWIVDMSSLGAAIGYGYTSAAALYYATKDNGETLSKVTGVLGIIFVIIFAVLLLVPIDIFNSKIASAS